MTIRKTMFDSKRLDGIFPIVEDAKPIVDHRTYFEGGRV